jgi:predicted CXXCH cytochrome family protein
MIPGIASATIVGSSHDLQAAAAGTTDQICIFCHTPHNALTAVAPLWNRAAHTGGGTYTVYTSPTSTLDATVGQPSGVSLLCMSCHDGTVGIDSYGGKTGTVKISGTPLLGTNLSNDHPISFQYTTSLATSDGELWNPSVKTVRLGTDTSQTGTVAAAMLFSNSVECASCHDVHNKEIPASGLYLLRDSMTGSELCLNCHDK